MIIVRTRKSIFYYIIILATNKSVKYAPKFTLSNTIPITPEYGLYGLFGELYHFTSLTV